MKSTESQRRLGIVIGYLNVAAGVVASLLYTPELTRILGQSEYGLYTFARSTVNYLTLLGFGLNSTYVRFCTRYVTNGDQEGLEKLNGTYLLVNTVIFVIALIAGGGIIIGSGPFLASSLTAEEISITKKLLAILIVNIALTFPLNLFSSFIAVREKFLVLKGLALLKTVLTPVLSIVVLRNGFRSVGVVMVSMIVMVAVEVTQAVFCFTRLKMRIGLRGLHKALFRDLLTFSAFVFVHIMADQLTWNMGNIIITKMLGAVPVAVYGLAALLCNYLRQFSSIFSSIYAPRVNQLVASGSTGEQLTSFYLRVARTQLAMMLFIVVGFILWGDYFVVIWGGEEYAGSYMVAVLLMVAVLPDLFMNIGIEIRRAMNKHQRPAVVMLITAVINCLISIPLVHFFGIIGATVGTLIAMMINSGYMTYYYQKYLGLQMGRFWGGIGKKALTLLPAVLMGVALHRFMPVNSTLSFVLVAAIYTALFWGYGFMAHLIGRWTAKKKQTT